MLPGNEIMGKSSDRVGGGEEVAGVLEAGVPFPPAQTKTIGNQNSTASLKFNIKEPPLVQIEISSHDVTCT